MWLDELRTQDVLRETQRARGSPAARINASQALTCARHNVPANCSLRRRFADSTDTQTAVASLSRTGGTASEVTRTRGTQQVGSAPSQRICSLLLQNLSVKVTRRLLHAANL